jgi:phosphoglycerate dehydrogenase-like enzyme
VTQSSAAKQRLLLMSPEIPSEHPVLQSARAAGIEVLYYDRPEYPSVDILTEIAKTVQGIVAGDERYPASVLQGSALKVISRLGIGVDSIDIPVATSLGIAVCNAPGANADSVADHAMAMMLCLARNLFKLDAEMKKGVWYRPLGTADFYPQTLGIIGLGRIGKRVAKRAKGFSMRIIATDPVWDESFAKEYGVERVSLEQVMRESDFVTVHCPSDATTRHLINAERLAMMKPTAFLVNCARGAIVDPVAIYEVLKARRIAGAGLDVFENEPLGMSPLCELDNAILTPHAAHFNPLSNKQVSQMALENAVAVMLGKEPPACANPEVLPKHG